MAVTFTQVPVKLSINKDSLPGVIDVLEMINGDNPNNIYTIETSFHVGSIVQADKVEAGLDSLKELGAIGTYQWNNTKHQVRSFRQAYLK